MDIFEWMKKDGHEQIIFNYDKETGMKAIIAIHDYKEAANRYAESRIQEIHKVKRLYVPR